MATNTGEGYRKGAVKDRTQFENPATGGFTKRDTNTGQFVGNSQEKFKGVRQEKPKK